MEAKMCFGCGCMGDIDKTIKIANPLDCSEEIFVNICGSCLETIRQNFLLVCITCGAYGHIPITPKSIFYLAESNMVNNIATTNYCPNCAKQTAQDYLIRYAGEGVA